MMIPAHIKQMPIPMMVSESICTPEDRIGSCHKGKDHPDDDCNADVSPGSLILVL